LPWHRRPAGASQKHRRDADATKLLTPILLGRQLHRRPRRHSHRLIRIPHQLLQYPPRPPLFRRPSIPNNKSHSPHPNTTPHIPIPSAPPPITPNPAPSSSHVNRSSYIREPKPNPASRYFRAAAASFFRTAFIPIRSIQARPSVLAASSPGFIRS